MNSFKRFLSALLMLLMLLGPAPLAAAESYTVYVSRENAKVYDDSGHELGRLPANTKLKLTGMKGDICRVSRDGKTAYMKKGDLSQSPVGGAAESQATQAVSAPEAASSSAGDMSVTVYASKDGAKVYNSDGDVLGTVPVNTKLTCTGMKGDVCRVKQDGKTAYMKKGDLSREPVQVAAPVQEVVPEVTKVETETEARDEAVESVHRTVYVVKEGAKVYSAGGKAMGEVPVNTKLTCTGISGDVCRVELDGKTGYMKKADLATSRVEAAASVTLKTGDTGEAVKKVQSRLKSLGYFDGEVAGNYQSMTKAAVEAFQKTAGLSVDGECGINTLEALFSDSAPKMPQTAELSAATSKGGTSSNSTVTPAHGTAISMDWWESDIQKIFSRGTTATITDVETGLAWQEQRRGGTNHADVQPLTAADTAVLKKVYGGTWSWNRRAIFVTIDGKNYAASMNGMPHGGGSISGNNFNGHHCIHFTNSRTHGSNKVCSLHQSAIQKALKAKL